jgi:hypothetical protein
LIESFSGDALEVRQVKIKDNLFTTDGDDSFFEWGSVDDREFVSCANPLHQIGFFDYENEDDDEDDLDLRNNVHVESLAEMTAQP